MAIAQDPNEVRNYILTQDRKLPEEEQTVFEIGVLDSRLMARLDDRTTQYAVNGKGSEEMADIKVNTKQRQYEIVKYGLRGWRNFKKSDGTLVPMPKVNTENLSHIGPRQALNDDSMKYLRPQWMQELAEAILNENTLTGEQEKNSVTPATSVANQS